jgi:hypothetical protein
MNSFGSTPSVSVYNKLEDGEPSGIKHLGLRKYLESVKSRIEVECIVFWSLVLLRCVQLERIILMIILLSFLE